MPPVAVDVVAAVAVAVAVAALEEGTAAPVRCDEGPVSASAGDESRDGRREVPIGEKVVVWTGSWSDMMLQEEERRSKGGFKELRRRSGAEGAKKPRRSGAKGGGRTAGNRQHL